MTDELYDQLAVQFPTEAHKTLERAGGQTYVPWNLVAERLNTVLGVEHWSFKVIREGFTSTECWVLGELSATIRDTVTVRQQYGCSPIVQGQRETPVDDLLKKAGTDAFKKCAQVLGVALYLTDADDRAEVKAAMAEARRPSPAPRPRPNTPPNEPTSIDRVRAAAMVTGAHPSSPIRTEVIRRYRAIAKHALEDGHPDADAINSVDPEKLSDNMLGEAMSRLQAKFPKTSKAIEASIG